MRSLLALLPLIAACDTAGKSCTEIGCAGSLVLQVVGVGDTTGLAGMITVAGHDFMVDCDGTSDPEVSCEAQTVSIFLSEAGGGEVVWSLAAGGDTGGGGGGYAGNGTFTPNWSESQPNGPDCPPTCWVGEGTVELQGTP